MAKYEVFITKTVQKQLKKLPNKIADKLETQMLQLEDNPRPTHCKKLSGREAYRIRVGNYRFIYIIKDKILLVNVIKVGHRKNIYK
ncbi:MAG: type II toxin-antitoxin system RelE/ParE family toxin [Bacteroidales bacterium]|nr:type II toxin-antitoxin system RelE/ParE family toxin [Bacteroidales bacterium]